MAMLRVNPTRMELTRLKARLKTARRGHKLLKDKRDEMMKQFLEIVRRNKELRVRLESELKSVYSEFSVASAVMSPEMLEQSLIYPKQEVGIELSYRNIMSVNVPRFEIKLKNDDPAEIYPYGYASTSGELDDAISSLSKLLKELLTLAEAEKSAQLLASEIEKTRRRVNALEYVMIPRYVETIKFITMKLEENERGTLSRLMKVKDMMIAEARAKE